MMDADIKSAIKAVRVALFQAAILPDGTRTGVGWLPCPHCGDMHLNPENGSDLWTLSQVKALVAMHASRVCTGCGTPSRVSMDDNRAGEACRNAEFDEG